MEINTCLWNTWKEDNVNTKIDSNKKPDLPEDFQFTISEIFCTVWDEHAINLTEFFLSQNEVNFFSMEQYFLQNWKVLI